MGKRRTIENRDNAPGRGRRIRTELVAPFRAEYLRTGSLTAAARAVKLPPSSCQGMVADAEADEVFVSARRSYLTRGLDRVEAMLIRSAEFASERIAEGPTVDAVGSIVDNGPQYFRGLADAHRSLVARAAKEKPEGESDASKSVEIVIRTTGDQAATTSQMPPTGDGAN